MSLLLLDLAEWLAERGHGFWSRTDPYPDGVTAIAVGLMPAAPDRCVLLESYAGGRPAAGSTNQPEVVEAVRIWARAGEDVADAALMCQRIHDDLDGRGFTVLPSGREVYNAVPLQRAPLGMGTDSRNRHRYSTVIELEHSHPTELRPA